MLSIRTEERAPFALLFFELFFLSVGVVLVQTAAFALFLATFGGGAIPYSDMAIAVIAAAISLVSLKLAERLAVPRLVTLQVAFMLLGTLLLWVGITTTHAGWIIFILPSWFQSIINLAFLVVYTLAGRIFDVRQAKRLFGLLGAGFPAAVTISGLTIPLIVTTIGVGNLFLLAAFMIAIGLALQVYTLRRYAAQVQTRSVGPQSADGTSDQPVLRSRYVLLIIATIMLSWIGFFVIDNIFYALAAARYPEATDLASFLGVFAAATGIASLVSSVVVTGFLLSRYGVRGGLLTLPVSLAGGAAGIVVASLLGGVAWLVFGFAVVSKLLSVAFMNATQFTSVAILYQPLPPHVRLRVQTICDTVFQPIGIGLAGIVLIIFTSLLAFGPAQLAWVFLVVAAIWLPVVILLARLYLQALTDALRERKLQASPLDLSDASSIAALQAGIQNPQPDAALFSLNLLQQVDPEALTAALPGLLAHSAPEMRAEALDRIAALGLTDAAPLVAHAAATDPSPAVQGHAVRALATLSGAGAVLPLLDDLTPEIQRGAMVGLLCAGRPQDIEVAETWLEGLARSPNPTQRALAAEVIEEAPQHERRLLDGLLADQNIDVRLAAIRASGTVNAPNIWPSVVAALAQPDTRGAARYALTAAGDKAMPAIAAAFRNDATPLSTRIDLARVCGRVRSTEAMRILETQLQAPDPTLRERVLAGLASGAYHAPAAMVAPIHHQIQDEIDLATWAMITLADLGQDDATALLHTEVQSILQQARERVFWLISFLEDRRTVLRARDAYWSKDTAQRAYALEVLDTRLPRDLKDVLAVLDDADPARSLKQLAWHYPHPKKSREKRLAEIIASDAKAASPWLRACAMDAAARLHATACAEAIGAAQGAAEPLVAETARDALARLSGALQEGTTMRSTIEKVIILKGTSLFASTPGEVLAAVAGEMRDVTAAAGETIIRQGEPGDSMYIIVQGQVRVHDGDHTLTYLGQGEVVGEMALLDPQPRAASVTAVEDTQLLRLDQDPFNELIEDRIEVTRAFMRILAGRIRALDRETVALQTQLAQQTAGS